MKHLLENIEIILRNEDEITELKIMKLEGEKVELWDGDGKYYGRQLVNFEKPVPKTQGKLKYKSYMTPEALLTAVQKNKWTIFQICSGPRGCVRLFYYQ
jgi:hypothetical protein